MYWNYEVTLYTCRMTCKYKSRRLQDVAVLLFVMSYFHKWRNLNKEQIWSFVSNFVNLLKKLTKCFKKSMEKARKLEERLAPLSWQRTLSHVTPCPVVYDWKKMGTMWFLAVPESENDVGGQALWHRRRDKIEQNKSYYVIDERRFRTVFMTVAGTMKQVCMCGRRVLWRGPLINYTYV